MRLADVHLGPVRDSVLAFPAPLGSEIARIAETRNRPESRIQDVTPQR